MATYKGIQGYSVQKLSSDPGTIENVQGQVWFNSTSATFKLATEQALSAGAWASAPNLNTARYYFDGAGSTTAGIVVAGSPNYYYVETFDGSSWTEVADVLSQKGYSGANGTQTAAMCVGSSTPSPTQTEMYDGTSWTEVAALNNGRSNKGPSAGPTTAAIVAGGTPGISETELWDGTSWTETGHDMNSPTVQGKAGFGVQTAMMAVGGEGPAVVVSETYDGSTWTEGNNLTTGRGNFSGSGTTTAGIVMGGSPYPVGQYSETYDGTSWTAAPTTSQSHGTGSATGDIGSSQSSAFIAGGYAPGHVNNVDIWTYTQFAAKTITVS